MFRLLKYTVPIAELMLHQCRWKDSHGGLTHKDLEIRSHNIFKALRNIRLQKFKKLCKIVGNQHKAGLELVCSPQISVKFYWTTQRYIPEDRTLHSHRCKNLKSNDDCFPCKI
jgi:hypothetical protein